MPYFITRVVLHQHATYQDYETLHAAMGRAGFSRTITGDDRVTYHLPPAEYVIQGSYQVNAVRDAAANAARQTGNYHSVLVTEGDRLSWENLAPA